MAKDKKTNPDCQPQNGPSRGAYESYNNQDSISRRQENQPASPDSSIQDDSRKDPASAEGGRGEAQRQQDGADGRAQHGEDLGDARPDPAAETSIPKLTND